jgi:hypothetical protein
MNDEVRDAPYEGARGAAPSPPNMPPPSAPARLFRIGTTSIQLIHTKPTATAGPSQRLLVGWSASYKSSHRPGPDRERGGLSVVVLEVGAGQGDDGGFSATSSGA